MKNALFFSPNYYEGSWKGIRGQNDNGDRAEQWQLTPVSLDVAPGRSLSIPTYTASSSNTAQTADSGKNFSRYFPSI